MLNIVLFGAPGAGKGTQSERLVEKYRFKHISTGDLLRGEIKASTKLGLEAKSYMDQGKLVPDEVVIGMIDAQLSQHSDVKGFVFDGFPRTVAQAEALDNLLAKHGESIAAMLRLLVPEQELINRLLERGKTSGRSDDNVETITKRINTYKVETEPVSDYYEEQRKLVRIEGVGPIDSIFQSLCEALGKLPQSA